MSREKITFYLLLVLLSAGLQFTVPQNLFAQSQPAPAPFGKFTENINGVTLELVRVPNGKFVMGNDHSPNPEEKPAHQVSLRSFYIGQFEVTRQQYNIVATTLPKIFWEMKSQYIALVFLGTGQRRPRQILFFGMRR